MPTAPIVLFTYARPEHTRRTVAALQKNVLSGDSDLIVFSDAARTPEKEIAVGEVRSYLAKISGFRSVSIRLRQQNFGLAKSIIEGVTEVLNSQGRAIVLEDDMVTSQHFLTYMNEALEQYADDERVASIHGYVYPVNQVLPEAFFLPGADCWGWATWRRAWVCFNPDGQYLLNELRRRKLIKSFNLNGAYPYSKMLENQINGVNDSWAIRWHASTFLADKLTLYPGRSLVQNIGNDSSGIHCGGDNCFDVELNEAPVDLEGVIVQVSLEGTKAFEAFFRKSKVSVFQRILHKIYRTLRLVQ